MIRSRDDIEFRSFFRPLESTYDEVWRFQKERVDAVAQNLASEAVLFCEHERLLTCGRRMRPENILDHSLPIFQIERGGDVTFHGPGQLVIYPILKLNSGRFPGGIQDYLRFLEQIVIDLLRDYGLHAGRFGPTGVWIRNQQAVEKKIASLGIAVRRWVTYHGLALNVTTDLSEFKKIRPCDFEAEIMTSMENEGLKTSVSEIATEIQKRLEASFLKRPSRTLSESREAEGFY